uniref:hypothetical protein n=1 Tax=Shewanella indica TaxID=768528 RepID=UPI0030058193
MLASLVEDTGSNRFIRTKHIGCDKPMLYSINLSQLTKVKIKDITSADHMKIAALVNGQGDLKLGFYRIARKTSPFRARMNSA